MRFDESAPGGFQRVALQGGYGAGRVLGFFPCGRGGLFFFLVAFVGFGFGDLMGDGRFLGLLFCLFYGALFCDGVFSHLFAGLFGPGKCGWCVGFCVQDPVGAAPGGMTSMGSGTWNLQLAEALPSVLWAVTVNT